MKELGKKDKIFGKEMLTPLNGFFGRPVSMPIVPDGHAVICGYDQGLGERMFVCDTVQDMQTLYDGYARGGALSIKWYSAPDPGFISAVGGH